MIYVHHLNQKLSFIILSDSTVAAEGIKVFYISKQPLFTDFLSIWRDQLVLDSRYVFALRLHYLLVATK